MISDRASKLKPYTAGEQPKDKTFIKLNTNENPFPPGEMAEAALKNIDADNLKLYPDPDASQLRALIAAKENVEPENIFMGNGSDEILAFAFYALFNGGVVFPDITYSFYPTYCTLFNIDYKVLPLDEDFSLIKEDYISKNYGGIVIANPNAPTSVAAQSGFIEQVVSTNKCNVLIDEAYIDFAPKGSSAAPLIKKYTNLLVVKTFSKSYSLAGIRCGYAIGSKELISALSAVKDSFNSYPLDHVCQKVCAAAVKDNAYHEKCCADIINIRERTVDELRASGIKVLDSSANFIFVKSPSSGKELFEYLRAQKVLVRFWDKPRISDYLRVSVGSFEQMERFTDAVKSFNKEINSKKEIF